jgi:hypothetical protein
MADDFWMLVIGLIMLSAGVTIGCFQAVRLLYPSMWDQGELFGDFLDREVAIVLKIFFGGAIAVTGLALAVYTPTLSEFFERWNGPDAEQEIALAPPVLPAETMLPPAELPSTLPRLPGTTGSDFPAPGTMVFPPLPPLATNEPATGADTSGETPAEPEPPRELLAPVHELLLGYSLQPPNGYKLVETISHDGPGFWRSLFRWQHAAHPTSYDVVLHGGDFAPPPLSDLAADAALNQSLPRLAKVLPRTKLLSSRLPATLFDTGTFQGAAISSTLETPQGQHAATIYLLPTSNVVIAVVAAGPGVASGQLRPALDASVQSLKRREAAGIQEFELEGYEGELPASENPWAAVGQ